MIEWMVIIGFVISFFLAFGIGANDVANSFGTSVGSKVLTLKQACILATIFEILGSILIGANVSGTIRKGILDPTKFNDNPDVLALGYVSALAGCCIWLIIATVLNLPVSGTHSIVGAIIGMALVSKDISIINGYKILEIVASWFISPLLSGVVSAVFFIAIRRFILRAENPLNSGLIFLPVIYTFTIVVNVGGVLQASPKLLKFDLIPVWGKVIIAVGIAIIVYLSVWLILVPRMRRVVTELMLAKEEKQDEYDNYNENEDKDGNPKIVHSVSTQVDHVALLLGITSSNEFEERLLKEQQQKPQLAISAVPVVETQAAINKLQKRMNPIRKRNRMDSEPIGSATNIDSDYSGDVNFTLSGYLHTIHSFRQYLQQRQHLPSTTSNESHHSPLTRLPESSNNTTLNQQPQKVPLLANMFNQEPTNEQVEQNKEQQPDIDAGEKKVGRFYTKPAKFEDDSLKAAIPVIQKGSMLEIDQEVEENIEELPQIEKKPPVVDKFAYVDPPEAAKLFSFLQILTAIFGSFAHGGNDVSNAIGPLIGLYLIYQDGYIKDKADTPEWILFYGGVGISVGLWILGRRVIKTIGEDLTKITPSSGFVIEIASAMTVLLASMIGIPVSTTHCKVGSVVFTGRVRAKQSVDWSLFRNIIIAWILTVPVTGGIAAICQLILKALFIK